MKNAIIPALLALALTAGAAGCAATDYNGMERGGDSRTDVGTSDIGTANGSGSNAGNSNAGISNTRNFSAGNANADRANRSGNTMRGAGWSNVSTTHNGVVNGSNRSLMSYGSDLIADISGRG